MPDILTIIMRWLHIASMATLVGGILYGRFVIVPAANGLAQDAAEALSERAAAQYKPLVFASMAGLLLSGIYRFLITPGHRPLYQSLFGIKMLLVLHVFAVAILIVKPHNPRRARMMTGVVISGMCIVAISAWLSRIY